MPPVIPPPPIPPVIPPPVMPPPVIPPSLPPAIRSPVMPPTAKTPWLKSGMAAVGGRERAAAATSEPGQILGWRSVQPQSASTKRPICACGLSAHSADPAQPVPSRPETPLAASPWRSVQNPLSPASAGSSPTNPAIHPGNNYTIIIAAGLCRGSLERGVRVHFDRERRRGRRCADAVLDRYRVLRWLRYRKIARCRGLGDPAARRVERQE